MGSYGYVREANKSDKALRQADRVEKRTEARPEQTPKKRKPGEDFSQAAARIVREATERP